MSSPQLATTWPFLRAAILGTMSSSDGLMFGGRFAWRQASDLTFNARGVTMLPVSRRQSTDSPTRKVATAKHGIVFSKR